MRYIGIGILGAVWLWLAWYVLASGGVTLINLFWVAASGIIVFVPLWKKFIRKDGHDKR